MQTVSRFESNLLSITYALMGQRPISQVISHIVQGTRCPSCLGRNAVELVQQALAKGMVRWLAHEGDAWKVDRHMRDDEIRSGRLWERTSPESLGFTFSQNSLEFLVWLTAEQPLKVNCWKPKRGVELTIGDELVFFRALDALRNTGVGARWMAEKVFARLPLVTLMFTEQLETNVDSKIDFTPWVDGIGASVLEALQTRLKDRWVEMEFAKRHVTELSRMNRIGQNQQIVLSALASSVARQGRFDLCRFWLVALSELMAEADTGRDWIGHLNVDALRLAERTSVYSNASSFLDFGNQLQTWATECATVGYFDEGYQAAQLWLVGWELYDGKRVTSRARDLAGELTF